MELRHIGIIRFLLQKDTERALLRDVPAASGGAHNLLGTALELGAASGGTCEEIALHIILTDTHVERQAIMTSSRLASTISTTRARRTRHWKGKA